MSEQEIERRERPLCSNLLIEFISTNQEGNLLMSFIHFSRLCELSSIYFLTTKKKQRLNVAERRLNGICLFHFIGLDFCNKTRFDAGFFLFLRIGVPQRGQLHEIRITRKTLIKINRLLILINLSLCVFCVQCL